MIGLEALRPGVDNVRLNPWTLVFHDRQLEASFRAELRDKSTTAIRLNLLLSLFLYGIFGILDFSVIPDAAPLAWLIRYAVVCPLILACLVVSFNERLGRHLSSLINAMALVAGLGIVIMMQAAAPPGRYMYYAGLLLVCTAIYTLFRLRFTEAFALTWVLVGIYEVAALISGPGSTILFNNTFFLIGTNAIGMIGCYSSERALRAAFLDRRTIETLARHDSLTGLLNRRAFFQAAEAELARCRRNETPLSALMLDVDHFKAINDRHGHATGDEVLQTLAATIAGLLRPSDHLCRYGGEEFLALLPATTELEAQQIAERLRLAVASLMLAGRSGSLRVTLSVGVSSLTATGLSSGLDSLLLAADRAVYSAKHSGRNVVVLAS